MEEAKWYWQKMAPCVQGIMHSPCPVLCIDITLMFYLFSYLSGCNEYHEWCQVLFALWQWGAWVACNTIYKYHFCTWWFFWVQFCVWHWSYHDFHELNLCKDKLVTISLVLIAGIIWLQALTVFEYLVLHGAERVIYEIREHAYQITVIPVSLWYLTTHHGVHSIMYHNLLRFSSLW